MVGLEVPVSRVRVNNLGECKTVHGGCEVSVKLSHDDGQFCVWEKKDSFWRPLCLAGTHGELAEMVKHNMKTQDSVFWNDVRMLIENAKIKRSR